MFKGLTLDLIWGHIKKIDREVEYLYECDKYIQIGKEKILNPAYILSKIKDLQRKGKYVYAVALLYSMMFAVPATKIPKYFKYEHFNLEKGRILLRRWVDIDVYKIDRKLFMLFAFVSLDKKAKKSRAHYSILLSRDLGINASIYRRSYLFFNLFRGVPASALYFYSPNAYEVVREVSHLYEKWKEESLKKI